jgi:hypothetical protein
MNKIVENILCNRSFTLDPIDQVEKAAHLIFRAK